MADILIKGMEMPDCCNYCVGMVVYAKDTDGVWKDTCKLTGKPIDLDNRDGRPSDCPLVEVPTHGRLGDLDLVEEWMRKKHKDNDCPFDIDAFLLALRKIPTVLEATISND